MRFLSAALLLAGTLLLFPPQTGAWLWNDDTLITIDGRRHTSEDFKHWWRNWREEGISLPATPGPFIDWLLLAREAERMDLAGEPSFQRRIDVFLQARTLLLLKQDAVDSRIKISDARIRERYESRYAPRWQVQLLYFNNESTAAAAYQELLNGSTGVDELLARSQEEGGPVSEHKQWQRPVKTDPGWLAIFEGLEIGQAASPVAMGHMYTVLRLVDRKEGDPEDMESLREQIHREIWKEQEEELTGKLLDQLRRKYKVQVDRDRLAALPVDAPDDAYTDAEIITTSRRNVTEKEFMAVLRREMHFRRQMGGSPEEEDQLKERLVNGIIAQTLTNWEALDRRYEEKEPFRHDYRFYRGHRLIMELERRLFAPGAVVTDEEVKAYYEANQPQYTRPETVNLSIVEDAHGLADKVWREVAVSGDFRAAVRELYQQDIPPRRIPFNHLEPEVQAAVSRLARGETSQPFNAGGRRLIVNLVERTPAAPIPLAEVAAEIRSKLQSEKMSQQRDAYLATVKSRSKIAVRERNWQAVIKELGEG